MLDIEILRDRGIAILTPRGKLEAADFATIGREVDPLIEAEGKLSGLMISADAFSD